MNSYIKQGDCLELMKEIPDGSVDMILCDLPYGTTKAPWDNKIDIDALWIQYKRIIKENGAIVLFSQMPFGAELIMSNKKMFRYEIIWHKTRPSGYLNSKKMPLRIHENLLVFYKHLPTYNPQMTDGKPYRHGESIRSELYGKHLKVETISNGKRFPTDVLRIPNGNHNNFHSTQKPIPLLEWIINTYTNEDDVVLDNCMGSGSTCVAAINTNRKYIGFEIDGAVFNVAEQRIKKAESKRSLS